MSGRACAVVAVLLAGCPKSPRTGVLVVSDTDLPVPAGLDEIRFEVVDPVGDSKTASSDLTRSGALPAVLALGVTADCGGGVNTRVIPRDARQSLLWRKLAAVDLCGRRMPRDGSPLPGVQIDMVRDWINAGAADN